MSARWLSCRLSFVGHVFNVPGFADFKHDQIVLHVFLNELLMRAVISLRHSHWSHMLAGYGLLNRPDVVLKLSLKLFDIVESACVSQTLE